MDNGGLALIRIGVIGSNEVDPRRDALVEELGFKLTEAGFGIVCGGMGGVMSAVARGSMRSDSWTPSTVLALLPNFSGSREHNPWTSDVIHTEMGVMRNELILRSCHAVVACGGGAGTLSEMALAWQRQLPMSSLVGTGGWANRLTGEVLDLRQAMSIEARGVELTIEWLNSLFPLGCFSFRQPAWYPMEVPCYHRVHNKSFLLGQTTQFRLGLSTEFDNIRAQLEELHTQVEKWNERVGRTCRALVTFDDGYRDVLMLCETFNQLPLLQPVVFVPDEFFSETPRWPLPMHRLYAMSELNGISIEDFPPSLQRQTLKSISIDNQNLRLDKANAPSDELLPQYLSLDDLKFLGHRGWIIGSHGPAHHDLRIFGTPVDVSLYSTSEHQLRSLNGSRPWLAWPEGWYDGESMNAARKGGFSLTFTIDGPGIWFEGERAVHRTIRG